MRAAPSVALATLMLAAAPAPTAVRQPPTHAIHRLPDDATTSAATLRGLVGEVVVEHAGPPLRAKLDQDLAAPIIVRVNALPATVGEGAPRRYRVEYIGSVAGVYDLRELIETLDGVAPTGLAAIPVRIVSDLPALHGSDLFDDGDAPFRITSHYRLLVGAVVAAWLAVPAWALWRRWRRRPAPAALAVAAGPPTLAEQLRPLVEAAMLKGPGGLDVDGQARLELLLIRFWRGRLGLDGLDPAAAIARVRRDPRAGQLIRAVERWLHGRRSNEPRPHEDVASLLAPYRDAAMIDDGEPRRDRATPAPAAASAPASGAPP